jgi:CAAX prenyl protease-like protein
MVPEARRMDSPSNPKATPPAGWQQWLAIPEVPRALPFALFLLIGSFQGKGFFGSEYWMYAAKTIGVGLLLWSIRAWLPEMKWSFRIEGVVVGLVIAGLWIGLDGKIPSLDELWGMGRKLITGKAPEPPKPDVPWNPLEFYKDAPLLGWTFLMIRVLGRSLVVPPLEEVFYRSFLYRYFANPKFAELPLNTWHLVSFLSTSAVFGLSHPGQWVQAILCGLAFQALVVRFGRIGDAMLAHATTNLVISIYAIATRQWQFT